MSQLLGILLHSIGGFSSASFYVPSHLVKRWAWATYWITLGLVAWIVMPQVGGQLTTPDLWGILRASPGSSLIQAYIFGAMWGFGGVLCGLALRFLGLSLGQSISLGVCAIVGTVVPAYLNGQLDLLVTTWPGRVVLLGFVVCVLGIAWCGWAGVRKERQLRGEPKQDAVTEFALGRGLLAALLGGILSACMAFALNAGKPIAEVARSAGTDTVFVNNPVFVLALAGGFTTNLFIALFLTAKNRSFGDFLGRPAKVLAVNYGASLLSGVMWYGQFFFYGMGQTKMGRYDFASWSIHMASIIIFSNLWGLWLKEWCGVDRRTRQVLWEGTAALVVSVILIGIGNGLAGR